MSSTESTPTPCSHADQRLELLEALDLMLAFLSWLSPEAVMAQKTAGHNSQLQKVRELNELSKQCKWCNISIKAWELQRMAVAGAYPLLNEFSKAFNARTVKSYDEVGMLGKLMWPILPAARYRDQGPAEGSGLRALEKQKYAPPVGGCIAAMHVQSDSGLTILAQNDNDHAWRHLAYRCNSLKATCIRTLGLADCRLVTLVGSIGVAALGDNRINIYNIAGDAADETEELPKPAVTSPELPDGQVSCLTAHGAKVVVGLTNGSVWEWWYYDSAWKEVLAQSGSPVNKIVIRATDEFLILDHRPALTYVSKRAGKRQFELVTEAGDGVTIESLALITGGWAVVTQSNAGAKMVVNLQGVTSSLDLPAVQQVLGAALSYDGALMALCTRTNTGNQVLRDLSIYALTHAG